MSNPFQPVRGEPTGLYFRASGDPRRDRASVTDQRAAGLSWVERSGAVVFGEYVDNAESASLLYEENREDFARLIADIRAGHLKLLWLWTLSRSQRRLGTFAALRDECWRAGVRWVINDRVYDLSDRGDRMALGFQALQDEDLPLQISANTRLGLAGRAARGLPPSTVVYGYRRVFDPETGKFLKQVIDRGKAEIVREAANRLLAGDSSWTIANDFNRRNIPTAKGKTWTHLTIRQMLLKEAYIGKRVSHGEIVADGVWPPILKEDVFYACRAILMDSGRRTTAGTKLKYLLSGIARCGKCGEFVYPKNVNGGLSYSCVKNYCVNRRMAVIDDYVTETVLEVLSLPDAADLFAVQQSDDRAAELRDRLQRRRADLAAWKAAAGAGDVKPVEYTEITAPIKRDIETLERQLQKLTSHPVLADVPGPDIRDRWPGFTLERRREIIRAMIGIELLPPGQGRWRTLDPATVVITPLWGSEAEG
ncbi:MAG: recombinase family protein [Saccharothrix sp.]|nr:recombinase family protein [Saccharothrix sp.]